MARYTLNLSEVCEQVTGLNFDDMEGISFDRIDTIANAAIPKIFSDRYDLFDNGDDRIDLLRMVLEHYWEYEICTYTPSDFILRINRKLNEIAPLYNQRYESTKLEYPVFEDVDYTSDGTDRDTDNTVDHTTGKTTNSGTDTDIRKHTGDIEVNDKEGGTTKFDGTVRDEDLGHDLTNAKGTDSTQVIGNQDPIKTHWDYNNDTPQNSIDGIKDKDYLTSYSKSTDEQEVKAVTADPVTRQDINGDTYTFGGVSWKSANNGSLTSNEGHEASKSHSKGTNLTNDNNTTTHGKTNNQVTEYGDTITSTLEHGHVIDTEGDLNRDFVHDGEDHRHVKGKQNMSRTYAEMLNSYRNAMINIYMEVIEELKELFFLIY